MVISIAAQKGGSGKTTTSISLASYLASIGKKVLFIDIDGQCNSTLNLLPGYSARAADMKPSETIAAILEDGRPLKIYSSRVENIHVIPSHALLSKANSILMQLMEKERRLEFAIKDIKDNYDFVIIDCPPDINELPINALVASDHLIIPINPSRYDIQGIKYLLEKMELVKKRLNPKLELLGFLLVMRDQTNLAKEIYSGLRAKFGDKVFNTQIPRIVKVREAEGNLTDIFEHAPYSPAAHAYRSWIELEILPKLS